MTDELKTINDAIASADEVLDDPDTPEVVRSLTTDLRTTLIQLRDALDS